MQAVSRAIETVLRRAVRAFPAVVLTGPRRAGKTWLLRRLFPQAPYFLLEDPDVVARVRSDPRAFCAEVEARARTGPVILDEVQNAPEVFSFVRTLVDRQPRRTGRWLLTGSQESALMRGVGESMAGRAAVLHLLPLSHAESPRVDPFMGGYPEALARPRAARLWFGSYVQTYLERDVRSVTAVRDLATFRRFISLLASRHGQLLNKTDLAAPLGVSVPTIGQWLGVLEITGQVIIVPPYFENLGKRLVKSPKVYLADSGLACHLLGIESRRDLERSPFHGPVFEGFIAAEIVKAQQNAGRRRELFHFRDEQGLEVDFVVPAGRETWLVEATASATVAPADARSLARLAAAIQGRTAGAIRPVLVHRPQRRDVVTGAVAPGVTALGWPDFSTSFSGR